MGVVGEEREEEAKVAEEVEREEPEPGKALETLEVGQALQEIPVAVVAPTILPPSKSQNYDVPSRERKWCDKDT